MSLEGDALVSLALAANRALMAIEIPSHTWVFGDRVL
jgi:hypothetical protein